MTIIPDEVALPSRTPNGPKSAKYPLLLTTLNFSASLVADLVNARNFTEPKAWSRCLGVYASFWLGEGGATYSEAVRENYHAIDKVRSSIISPWLLTDHFQAKYQVASGGSEDGELLCDTLFSLAYGALLLLSHTTLRLIRGRRYGILGTNGSGKSTLMRQLRDGKVENFPPQDQIRCIMVEHALQGEDTSLSVLDFIASG